MKTLWVLRHGDATHDAVSDETRELSDLGVQQVKQQALFMQSIEAKIDKIWVSPYLRTQQTAKCFLSNWSSPLEQILTVDELQPDSSVTSLINCLATSAPDHLLIISHQPLVNSLLKCLCDSQEKSGRIEFMRTASLAKLNSELWQLDWASLDFMKHAEQ